MDEMNVEVFKEHIARGTEIDGNMIEVIERFIDQSDVKIFYPKNLFADDKPLEVYFSKKIKSLL
ncbi:DUF3908 family protein [Pseudobacillus sp. FSL P4-0506]|uniref:DUF3908 family protein n=1 Tax=Pseudobacillus sp. FSL P4-0506 TaxID=2921576 RepID=UPI0030FB5850